jgi:hypothetical protein
LNYTSTRCMRFFLYIKQQILFSKKEEIEIAWDWNKKQHYFFKNLIIKGGFFFQVRPLKNKGWNDFFFLVKGVENTLKKKTTLFIDLVSSNLVVDRKSSLRFCFIKKYDFQPNLT